MAISVQIELDDKEELAFAAFFHECLATKPDLKPGELLKSLALGVVFDDLQTHREESALN